MAQAETDPTEPWPWLSIDDDLFEHWRPRLESNREAVGELWDFLRNPETHSAYIRFDGAPPPGWVSWLSPISASLVVLSYFYAGTFDLLRGEFWRNTAHPEVVFDGVGDRLEIHRPIYVHGPGPLLPGGTFLAWRTDAERWERLYFPMAVAPPPPLGKEPTPVPKKKRRKAKPALAKTRRRGPKGEILPRVVAAMRHDLSEGLSLDEIKAMPDKTLEGRYSAKRERIRAALLVVADELKK